MKKTQVSLALRVRLAESLVMSTMFYTKEHWPPSVARKKK